MVKPQTILRFLNADLRSVSCKWNIYSVSASCAGRTKDMHRMSYQGSHGEDYCSVSPGNGVTPGRAWWPREEAAGHHCVCWGNWCEQRWKEEWETQGRVSIAEVRVWNLFSPFSLQVLQMFFHWVLMLGNGAMCKTFSVLLLSLLSSSNCCVKWQIFIQLLP